MNETPTSRSTRSAPPERGMAYRTRVPGSRSPRSSRRSGKPATRRRGQVERHFKGKRVRDAQRPDPSGCRPRESCLRSKDSRAVRRGAVGKVPRGNSLAAYSTSSTVLRGGGAGDAAPLPDDTIRRPACWRTFPRTRPTYWPWSVGRTEIATSAGAPSTTSADAGNVSGGAALAAARRGVPSFSCASFVTLPKSETRVVSGSRQCLDVTTAERGRG
jgi:hypothetical protein